MVQTNTAETILEETLPKPTTYLKGFNFVNFLKRRHFIGRVHPWKKLEQNESPMLALLVPLQNAFDECIELSGGYSDPSVSEWNARYTGSHDITKKEFLEYLKQNNIQVFNHVDDFVMAREQYDENRKKLNPITPRLEQILEQIEVSADRVKYDSELDRVVISGKHGCIYEDEIDPSRIHLHACGYSQRKWSAIKRQLRFMNLIKEEGLEGYFSLATGKDLLLEQARIIRKVVGLNKKPTYTAERKEALKKQLSTVRPQTKAKSEGILSKVA